VDGDGVLNEMDNCPTLPSPSAGDVDGDGELNEGLPACGVLCDEDGDGQVDAGCPCIGELFQFLSNAPDLECCPGLVPVPACTMESSYECTGDECDFFCGCPDNLVFVCTPCGNGQCDPGETVCNCQDCLVF